MKENYENLRKEYPEYISKIQLYQICHISPRSATYLLKHGIIPAIDTGKATWRYRIKLDDVIRYLELRDEQGSQIPKGAVNSHGRSAGLKSFADVIPPSETAELADYFEAVLSDSPDVMSVQQIVGVLGISHKTILKKLQRGEMKGLKIGNKYQVPKPWLLEYMMSPSFLTIGNGTQAFQKLMQGLEDWKNKQNER